jgi:hypothetical protein
MCIDLIVNISALLCRQTLCQRGEIWPRPTRPTTSRPPAVPCMPSTNTAPRSAQLAWRRRGTCCGRSAGSRRLLRPSSCWQDGRTRQVRPLWPPSPLLACPARVCLRLHGRRFRRRALAIAAAPGRRHDAPGSRGSACHAAAAGDGRRAPGSGPAAAGTLPSRWVLVAGCLVPAQPGGGGRPP